MSVLGRPQLSELYDMRGGRQPQNQQRLWQGTAL
jgi:hypothetical protein